MASCGSRTRAGVRQKARLLFHPYLADLLSCKYTQVVIVNQHMRQPQPPPQQMQPPPQVVIARPRGDGHGSSSPPDAYSPQFPAIPAFTAGGASPMETPASSGQSQPQVKYHKQVCLRVVVENPVSSAMLCLASPVSIIVPAALISELYGVAAPISTGTHYVMTSTCWAATVAILAQPQHRWYNRVSADQMHCAHP